MFNKNENQEDMEEKLVELKRDIKSDREKQIKKLKEQISKLLSQYNNTLMNQEGEIENLEERIEDVDRSRMIKKNMDQIESVSTRLYDLKDNLEKKIQDLEEDNNDKKLKNFRISLNKKLDNFRQEERERIKETKEYLFKEILSVIFDKSEIYENLNQLDKEERIEITGALRKNGYKAREIADLLQVDKRSIYRYFNETESK